MPTPNPTFRRKTMKRKRKPKMKTRNKMLAFACVMVITYTVFDMILGFKSLKVGYSIQFDSTLTDNVFRFAEWVFGTSATITLGKTLKGKTNSDEDESFQIPPE